MAERLDIPFNVSILTVGPDKLRNIIPVTALDITDGTSNNYHQQGLYSTEIFGRVGDEVRNKRFSYIDIRISIFHPILYRAILDLKRFYGEIISGKEYAVWDSTLKDFVRSNAMEGKTGFNFFVSHWNDIVFEESKSSLRNLNIELINKFKSVALTDKIIVMPAGYRDIEIDRNGRMKEDEVNSFYKRLLSISNTITTVAVKSNPEILDTARYNLQVTFNNLYDYIESMIKGKHKLLMGKWASRRIFNGTRNVISAVDLTTKYLGSKSAISSNDTTIGMYQALKAILPVACYQIRNSFIANLFTSPNNPVRLINKKTLKSESVVLKPYFFDRWATNEGIEKVIGSFSNNNIRHKFVEVDNYYLALIYLGPDSTFKILHDIDEVPSNRSKKDVRPITLTELLYICTYKVANKYPILFTRYPITGVGSIYPSMMYMKTTIKSEIRKPLSDTWEPMSEDDAAFQFPIYNGEFVNTLSPSPYALGRLGAD